MNESDLIPCRDCGQKPNVYGRLIPDQDKFKVLCRCGYIVTDRSMARTVRMWNESMEDEEFWRDYPFPEYDGTGRVQLVLNVTRQVWRKERSKNHDE